MDKQRTFRRWGIRLLGAAWGTAVIIIWLPAYHGEVSPGAVMTLIGLQVLLFTFIFGFALLGFGDPTLFVMATLPITLFLLTPLVLLPRLAHHSGLPAVWGGLLLLSTAFPIIAALYPLEGVNERLFGFYALPLPLLLSGLALCVLSHAGTLQAREIRLPVERRCAG